MNLCKKGLRNGHLRKYILTTPAHAAAGKSISSAAEENKCGSNFNGDRKRAVYVLLLFFFLYRVWKGRFFLVGIQ